MKFLRSLELEWKLIFIASVIFLAFYFPVQSLFHNRLYQTIMSSSDPVLEDHLRDRIDQTEGVDRTEAVELLERQLQWKASAPLVLREQKKQFQHVSLTLLITLLGAAFLSFSRLTRPLRVLASAVEKIGHGQSVDIAMRSGGSMGVLETKVNELQHELADLRKREQLAGMERAWRDIAKVMAHEIKNPLTPMRLSVDRIDEKIALESELSAEEMKRFTERMNRQLDTLEQLVNRFRSFSREPEAHCESFDPVQLIRETAEDMGSVIATSITGSGSVYADRSLLRQVVLNVFKNSVHATATTMTVSVSEKNHLVRIVLRDNGKGVVADKLPLLFLPYVTFSEGGSGIGLSVVKNLVEAMGGSVRAESVEGDGFAIEVVFKSGESA